LNESEKEEDEKVSLSDPSTKESRSTNKHVQKIPKARIESTQTAQLYK
jgi:hypothetical protein